MSDRITILKPIFHRPQVVGIFCSNECPFLHVDAPLAKTGKAYCKLIENPLRLIEEDDTDYRLIKRDPDCQYGERLYGILRRILGEEGLRALARGYQEN